MRKSVRIGKCLKCKVPEVESVRSVKCQNWKVSELESVKIGRFLNLKESQLQSVTIQKCLMLFSMVLYIESIIVEGLENASTFQRTKWVKTLSIQTFPIYHSIL